MRKPGKPILLLLLNLMPIYLANSQDVTVTSAFDTSRIYLGDQINYTITIDQPSDLKLILPAFRDTLVKHIDILSGPKLDSVTTGGRTRIIEKYLVTSFDSGRYEVPPVYAEMRNENGLRRFYSDYALLEVMRVNIAPADSSEKFFDIVDPYKAPISAGEILPWILYAGIAAALIWFGRKYLRKLIRPGVEPEVIINPDPAHIIAFRELEKLREEKLWQKGDVKQYYTRLTEILRQYLENRFSVYSLELTTSETLEALLRTGFKKDGAYKQLRDVLNGADLVKFAKYAPEPSEHESMYEESWNFVMTTKEKPPEIEPSESGNKEGEDVQ